MKSSELIGRVASALPEQWDDLDLSQRELERLSGVSRSTLSRIKRGARVNPALVVRVAGVLNTLELAAPDEEDDPLHRTDESEQALDNFGRELDRWVVDSLGTAVRMQDGAA